MAQSFSATISAESPRCATWLAVFGSRTVPILSPAAVHGTAPGTGDALFYLVDVNRLTIDQRHRLVSHLAASFELPRHEVEADLDGEHGCPILAEDVTVAMDARFF